MGDDPKVIHVYLHEVPRKKCLCDPDMMPNPWCSVHGNPVLPSEISPKMTR